MRERLTLEVEVGARILHGGVQAGVTEPLADGGEVHACLEQMDGRRVAQRVRVNALAGQCRRGIGGRLNALLKEIANTEPRQWGTVRIKEDASVRGVFVRAGLPLDQVLQ